MVKTTKNTLGILFVVMLAACLFVCSALWFSLK